MFQKKLNKLGNLIEKIKNDITIPLISDFLDWFFEKLNIHFNRKTPKLKLNKGDIYFIKLGQNIGSELNKQRPCIVYSHYFFNNGQTITVIPLKSYYGKKFNKNVNIFIKSDKINSLKEDSIADISGIRQISKKRLGQYIGKIENNILSKIDNKLLKFLGIKKQTAIK